MRQKAAKPSEENMATVAPYHTDSPEYPRQQDVWHDKDTCPDGKRILPKHLKPGKGTNRRHCYECDKVS
jgi:hypothetical protein